MKASLRRWPGLLLAFAAMLLWLPTAQARPVPVPAMSSRVVDLTNTLQASEADDLRQQIDALQADTQAQLAVLIVPTTGEDSIEQFATRVFAEWKLGREAEDDGLLLLVALKDRRMRIEVGTGLEGKITDIQAARIIDQQMTPRFRSGDFAGGIRTAVQSLSLLVGGTLYGTAAPQVQGAQEVPSSVDPTPWRSTGGVAPAGWALFAVLLWSIAIGAWHGRRRPKPAPTAEDWLAHRAPVEETHASGKRKKRRKNAERSRPPPPVAAPATAPFQRWPFSMALLAAAPLVVATVLASPALLGMLLFLPAPVGFGLGIACSRSGSGAVWARIVTAIVLLLIVALTFAGKFMNPADVGLGMMYMVIVAIALAYLAAVGLGARNAWRESPRGFWARLIFVLGAMAILGWTFYQGEVDDIGLPLLLVAAVSSAFAFLPKAFNLKIDSSSRSRGSSGGSWSSSSSSDSSSSSSSSSSSGGGGSSSGGGASGSW